MPSAPLTVPQIAQKNVHDLASAMMAYCPYIEEEGECVSECMRRRESDVYGVSRVEVVNIYNMKE